MKTNYCFVVLFTVVFFSIINNLFAQTAKEYTDSAGILYANLDYNNTIYNCNKAIKADKKYALAYYWRAMANNGLKNYATAQQDFQKAIKLDSGISSLIFKPKYIRSFDKNSLKGQDIAILMSNDIAMISTGPIVKGNAVNDSAFTYGMLAFNKEMQGDYASALDASTNDIRLCADCPYSYIERGKIKRALKDYDGAIKDMTYGITLNPLNIGYYNERGIVKFVSKDYQGAIDDYTKAINLNPTPEWTGDIYKNRARSYDCMGDYRSALIDYSIALTLLHNKISVVLGDTISREATIYNGMGLAKQHAGNFKAAIDDYTKCIALNPDSANAYYNRGNAEYEMGNKIKACLDWNTAARLNDSMANDCLTKYCQ